jgi:rhodanese-related sulfurtransferase
MNDWILRVAVPMIAAVAAAAPVFAASPWPDSVGAMVAKAAKDIPTVDRVGYLKVVQDPQGALILDVREPGEFATGHVPGAINIPRGVLEFAIWKVVGYPGNVDFHRTIYVQCQTGGRASLAAHALKSLGFKHPVIALVDFSLWEKIGNPVVK